MIKVKRDSDGKIFTNDMAVEEGIYEIHFCTSYAQVRVQEFDCNGKLTSKDIICPPIGTQGSFLDYIAVYDDETGDFID